MRAPAIASCVVAVAILVACCVYMALPIEPFAYYKDLGFDHEITAWAAQTIHGPRDFFDALGWAPWNGTPLFYLSSYACDLVSVPISLVVGNAWLAIKIVQVLQVGVAAVGAAAMFATTRRSRFWAASFGFLYAALPSTELAIRGNMELGWIAALMPGAFAVGKLALRRFGLRAIPFVGAVCGLVGGVIAIEYVLFVSLPLFVLIVLAERRHPTRALVFYAILGTICCFTIGAFFLVPTFVHPLFTDAAARTVTLASGAFLDNFSESWVGIFTLVPRESLVSPTLEFNGTNALPTLYPAAILWWIGAIAFLRTTRTARTSSDAASLAVIAACAILALGTALPFGRALWNVLFLIPHLDAIRTTDRFLAIPALFVSFWFVLELQTLSQRFHRMRSTFGFGALATTLAAVAYAGSQHCFSVDPSIGARMPQFVPVATTVAAIGGRTASFAGVNGGSSNDVADYGLPQPISAAYLDLGGRFFQDGLGAAGMLGRIGVKSIVTSPNWTYDTPDVPPSSNVYRHVAVARTVFTSPEDVRVARIAGRAPVSNVLIACTYGGPEGFDAAHVSAAASDFAFAEPGATCERSAYIDFDPHDAWRDGRTIDAWSAASLLHGVARERDRDYPYLPNRVLLDVPWYRNSIDGERPVFDVAGTVRLAEDTSVVIPPHAAWPANAIVAVRLAAHRSGRLTLRINGRTYARPFAASYGFCWVSFRLTHDVPVAAAVGLAIESDDARAKGDEFTALDGVVVARATPIPTGARPSLFIASIRRFAHVERDRPPAIRRLSLVATDSMHDDLVGSDHALVADARFARAIYRWTGPPGDYELALTAALRTRGASVSISTGRTACCSATAVTPTDLARDTGAFAPARLRPGSKVEVRFMSPSFDPTSADRVLAVTAVRRSSVEVTDDPAAGDVDFANPLTALAHMSVVRGIDVDRDGASGTAGSSLAFKISSRFPDAGVALAIERSGDGSGSVSLVCGVRTVTQTLTTESRTVALEGGQGGACVGRISWTAGSFTIQRLTVVPRAPVTVRRSARIWTSSGSYVLEHSDDLGRPVDARTVRIDGCVGSRCMFAFDGYRRVDVALPLGANGTLALRRVEASSRARLGLRADGATRWTVTVDRRSDLELTELFDGEWHALGRNRSILGERCDIANTCFANVPPGTYRIVHSWPVQLRAGIAITLATALGALALMMLPSRRRAVS